MYARAAKIGMKAYQDYYIMRLFQNVDVIQCHTAGLPC